MGQVAGPNGRCALAQPQIDGDHQILTFHVLGGVFLAFDLFKEGLGEARAYVFAAHAPTLSDTSAWSELPGFARGYSDAVFPEALERVGHLVPWPAAALFVAGAWWVLARRRL